MGHDDMVTAAFMAGHHAASEGQPAVASCSAYLRSTAEEVFDTSPAEGDVEAAARAGWDGGRDVAATMLQAVRLACCEAGFGPFANRLEQIEAAVRDFPTPANLTQMVQAAARLRGVR